MARILYGIHGTGHGHAMRGLTIARSMPQHEFLFVANDDAVDVLEPEFHVTRLPNLGTRFKNYKVDFGATIANAIPILKNRQKYIDEGLRIIRRFKPDACMTDLEYFVPAAAKVAGIPCLTLDHQHVLTCCRHDLPVGMLWDGFIQGLTPRWLFRPTEASLLISFYSPPVLPRYNAIVAPPILREQVLGLTPRDEGHIVAYQSNSTDTRLIDFLQNTGRKAYVYGYRDRCGHSGNVIFKKKSEEEFLLLLASCSYVVQGGSHTLMSEALHLGKPILSIPLKAMIEQRLNALYLERLGYGMRADMAELNRALMEKFENNLDLYKAKIAGHPSNGNKLVFSLVDAFAKTGKLPPVATESCETA